MEDEFVLGESKNKRGKDSFENSHFSGEVTCLLPCFEPPVQIGISYI
jgi:hypothetical protein